MYVYVCVCVCVCTESLCCALETQDCKSTVFQDKVKIIFNGKREIFEMQITKC